MHHRTGLAATLVAASALMLTATGAAAKGDAAKGETAFRQRCAACHSVQPGAPSGAGPNLSGVMGRKAASASGFGYSPALKASGLTWSPEQLNKFIAAPGSAVPGTLMPISVPKPEDRDDLIAYLAKQK